MNTPNVHAGRLERRVRRVGRETMPGIHGFCSLPLSLIRRITSLYPPYGLFFTLGAIRGVPLLRLIALLLFGSLPSFFYLLRSKILPVSLIISLTKIEGIVIGSQYKAVKISAYTNILLYSELILNLLLIIFSNANFLSIGDG